MKTYQVNKINSLQVYRGIAAVLVVLFHVTSYSREKFNYNFLGGMFTFGFTGVDFFFVLSGFIIFFIHAKDAGSRQGVSKYVTKRLIRVYPIYWLVTAAKVIAIILIPSIAKPYEKEISTIINSFLLLPQVDLPIIGAAWTLRHEMLFYMLFASIIWFGWRWGLSIMGIWFISILGFTIGRGMGLPTSTPYLLTFLLNEQNLEFMLGCLSAYIVMNHKLKHPLLIALAGGILFALSGWHIMNVGSVFSYTLLFGIPSLLLVTGSASFEMEKIITLPKSLIFIGDASYSIYLTHAMFVNIFSLIVNRLTITSIINPLLITSTMAIGAITGGLVVHQLLERPLLSTLREWTIQRGKRSQQSSDIICPSELPGA